MGDIELQIFSERIKEVRTSLNMTQKAFAAELGITASALSAYEKNGINPSISIAKGIAEKYHISIDWLCGLSDTKTINGENNIYTYSDIIKICQNTKRPIESINNICDSLYRNMHLFMRDFEHMTKLKSDKMIDQELFDLWIEKTLLKYDKPITLDYNEQNKDSLDES